MKLWLLLQFVVLTHSSSPSEQPSKHSSLHVRTNNQNAIATCRFMKELRAEKNPSSLA